MWHDENDWYNDDEDCLIDGVGFAEPGSDSALRAATKDNPRDQPCPTCHLAKQANTHRRSASLSMQLMRRCTRERIRYPVL